MKAEIRQLYREEISAALYLVWEVFLEFEAPDYSQEGTITFRNYIDLESILEKLDNKQMFFYGYFINQELVGVIATKNTNHLSMLFVKKRASSKRYCYKII